MPELPEVETIVRDLRKHIIGRKIKSIDILVEKLFYGDKKQLIGAKIIRAERIGKNILIYLDNNYILHIHLKMTGQLIFLNKKIRNSKLETRNSKHLPEMPTRWQAGIQNSNLKIINNIFRISDLGFRISTHSVAGGHPDPKYNQPLPHKYTHIIIKFTDKSVLYYNDLRKFGWMKVIQAPRNKKQISNKFQISNIKLGLDALSSKLNANYLANICKKRKITIKQLLLDQGVVAGIGNIYADEVLFCARILPNKKTNDLTKIEINKIVKYIPIILNKSIDLGGTSKSDYVKLDGTRGNYLDFAFVYGRENKKCRNCKSKIKRIKIGQRSSHFCPNCQK